MLDTMERDPFGNSRTASATMRPVYFAGCFGWLHITDAKMSAKTAVVLCAGIKHDGMRGYRSYRLLADALAAAGYPTLRFDYPGSCNSSDASNTENGEIEMLAIWQASIHAASDWIRQQSGAQQIVLGGLRFGATLAAMVAAQREDVVGLMLLAPILRGRSFVSQLSVEANFHDSSVSTNGPLVLHELYLSRKTVELVRNVDLRKVSVPAGCRVGVFSQADSPVMTACVDGWRRGGADVTCADFEGLEPMLRPVFMNHETPADVKRVAMWLQAMVPPGQSWAFQDDLPLSANLRLDACIETPIQFGPMKQLFGILCRPKERPEADMVVIIGNSSGDHTCGYGRFAVHLARLLAAEGIASLRMDFAGVGDSLADGDRPTHVFECDRRADFAAAIDALAERGYRQFALQGLCSGAYHAFRAALTDPRVGSMLLVNLPLFEWKDGVRVEHLSHVVESPTRFLQKMGRMDLWLQMARGQLDIGSRLATQCVWLAIKTKGIMSSLARRFGITLPLNFGQKSAYQLSRRARILYLFSEGDPGIAALNREFGPDGIPAGATVRIVSGLDHSLSGYAMQVTASKHIIEFFKHEVSSFTLQETGLLSQEN